VGVPVLVFGESLVDAVVEVLVVGEDDVPPNIVELSMSVCGGPMAGVSTHKALWGHISRGQTTRCLVRVYDEP
jgi:hypothetical protein